MARPAGLEPATLGLEGRCSIQMSYGRIKNQPCHHAARKKFGRGREIRTPDILLPKQARYQTALYPVTFTTTQHRLPRRRLLREAGILLMDQRRVNNQY